LKDRHDYLVKFKTVKKWIRNLSGDTPTTYLDDFSYWYVWLRDGDSLFKGFTPDQLVEYQQKHRGYEIVDELINYLHDIKDGVSTGTISRRDTVVKSFFMHNRAALPEDVYSVKGAVPSTPGTLSREEIRQVILASNPLYRAVFTCMYAGFMGWGELDYWNRNGLDELNKQLERGDRIIVAWQSGRKQYAGIPFYNLIGGDALDMLVIYREESGKRSDKCIFKTKRSTPLNYSATRQYWMLRLDRLGFIDREKGAETGVRYGKNLHEIRDVSRTQWSRSPAKPIIAEFMMGHKSQLDPNEYDKVVRDPEYSMREYRKALPWLNILSEDPDMIPLEQHEAEMDRLRAVEEAVKPLQGLMTDPQFRRDLSQLLDKTKKRYEKE